jgi:hypothetical protein
MICIPWLEGDDRLWHLQPRVNLMREHVKLAKKMKLDGVVAIHWRTQEILLNFEAFAHYAKDPDSESTVTDIYNIHLQENYGPLAAEKLTDVLVNHDIEQWDQGQSPEFYAYNPGWGKMGTPVIKKVYKLLNTIDTVLAHTQEKHFSDKLNWLSANYQFALLLNEVGRGMEPAYELMSRYYSTGRLDQMEVEVAKSQMDKIPIQNLFRVYASRVRSKGELGVLSALNQKLWIQYLELKTFLEDCKNISQGK